MKNFTRGIDPKVAMDIGGINFNAQFDDFFNTWYKSIKSLEGKTIIAIMTKYWIENGKQKQKNKSLHTVKIKKIEDIVLTNMISTHYFWKITLNGEDGAKYKLKLDQKIHIK
jgi:hypothetical protein